MTFDYVRVPGFLQDDSRLWGFKHFSQHKTCQYVYREISGIQELSGFLQGSSQEPFPRILTLVPFGMSLCWPFLSATFGTVSITPRNVSKRPYPRIIRGSFAWRRVVASDISTFGALLSRNLYGTFQPMMNLKQLQRLRKSDARQRVPRRSSAPGSGRRSSRP